GAAHQAGDVDEGQSRRDDLRRFRDFGERVEPRIGDGDLADIRLDSAERIVGRLRRRGLRQRIEQRRLADIGQPDDTAFESHNVLYQYSSCLALCRASTSFLSAEAKTWMAGPSPRRSGFGRAGGTSPAMTMESQPLLLSAVFLFEKSLALQRQMHLVLERGV